MTEISCEKFTNKGQGISFVELIESDDSAELFVHYFLDIVPNGTLTRKENYVILGGSRIPVDIVDLEVQSSRIVKLQLNRIGDFSSYNVKIIANDIDPFFANKKFNFRQQCSSEFDCRPTKSSASTLIPDLHQTMDYSSKDFDSFKQSLLEFTSHRFPQWKSFPESDFGMVMLELFSYVGDMLSYYQDRIINEGMLETALHRFSIKSHLELIDYSLGNGISAKTFLHISAKRETILPKGFLVSNFSLYDNLTVNNEQLFFETEEDTYIHPDLNNIDFFCGDNISCFLARGSTSALILDPTGTLYDILEKDSYLIITGKTNSIIQLSQKPKPIIVPDPADPSLQTRLLEISWYDSFALKYDYYLDNPGVQCFGNIAVASHGRTIFESKKALSNHLSTESDFLPVSSNQRYFMLSYYPLSFTKNNNHVLSSLKVQINGEYWSESDTLLAQNNMDKVYAVFVDGSGRAFVVSGDGNNGMKFPLDSTIDVKYRVGTGTVGNIGINVLTEFETKRYSDSVDFVTNLTPGEGGRNLEDTSTTKLLAPRYIHKQNRAVTEADYERVVTKHPLVHRAKAFFRWTGSWHTVFVSIDTQSNLDTQSNKKNDNEIANEVFEFLEQKRMLGYDLQINPPAYVPLKLDLCITVSDDFFVSVVEENVLATLSSKTNQDGSKGLFHPDNITFGESIYISHIISKVKGVAGVVNVIIEDFRRRTDDILRYQDYKEKGYVNAKETEVFVLENDANFPENGIINIRTVGGKLG